MNSYLSHLERRIGNILKSMSIEEKVAQLQSISVDRLLEGKNFSEEKAKQLLRYGIGEITRVGGSRIGLRPREAARIVNEIQKFLVEKTRLGIPAIVHEECLAGLMAPTATVFPQAIALASTWSPEIVNRVANAIREQVLCIGSRHCLSPVLDLCRDPRWGRCEETYGEDQYLVSAIGTAYILGLQGEDISKGVIATTKHFAGHGFPEGGRNIGPLHAGLREFMEQHLYTFEVGIKVGGALSVMPAYHEIDGVPCHANKWLLTDVLRGLWGFRGVIVSDYSAVLQLNTIHRIARNCVEAFKIALEAGVDIIFPDIICFDDIVKAVKEGLISEAVLDRAVERVLRVKALLGLFDNPYVDETKVPEILDNEIHRKLALEAARESIVLLKNDGVLPLSKDIKTIAVIGPNANEPRNMLGDYHYDAHLGKDSTSVNVVTVLEGIKRKVSKDTKVLYAKGCDIYSQDRSGFEEALRIAREADVIVAVMGEKSGLDPTWFGLKQEIVQHTSGEGVDRSDLRLPGVQEDLIKELHKVGKPIVLVLINGRPLAITEILPYVNAVVEAWFPGEEGGNAIADVLFGDVDPGGRLPVSIPKSVGQVPVYYSRKPSAFRNYIDVDSKPLFPFGFGLSYTQFKYSNLVVKTPDVNPFGYVEIEVTVENIGKRPGKEVVQLYIAKEFSSVARPVKELKGFKKIYLEPGQTKRLLFRVPTELLAFYDSDMHLVIEPGEYRVMIGRSSEDIQLEGKFRIVGEKQIIQHRKHYFSEAIEL
ncbi:glycoside hydrolase family 3 N-terminal domain-containing protein [Ignisphaera sp. 4213-co]|uniref:Glycoside hydrolase family 3 N-terminal domain-containing protein n=1 Tax=Ignisphaera cupida TaxID=3050454 RepID=A0ABD4Z5M9_9CREN|nr:glycoside hydrolase family 3 N-terminal domain-containing protein [Ignisphaera sp. 4213-co]MDK6028606.1 glycoside hydrolase family 3 N-terminal domain-containing protein [Ignisphaera sp. 4213-co]